MDEAVETLDGDANENERNNVHEDNEVVVVGTIPCPTNCMEKNQSEEGKNW